MKIFTLILLLLSNNVMAYTEDDVTNYKQIGFLMGASTICNNDPKNMIEKVDKWAKDTFGKDFKQKRYVWSTAMQTGALLQKAGNSPFACWEVKNKWNEKKEQL